MNNFKAFFPVPPVLHIELEEDDNERILRCKADGNPKIYEFIGWRHSSPFNETIRNFEGGGNGILAISKSNETSVYEDSGTYICFAQNGIADSKGIVIQRGSVDLKYQGLYY